MEENNNHTNDLVEGLIKEACETIALEQETAMQKALDAWPQMHACTSVVIRRRGAMLGLAAEIGLSSQIEGQLGRDGLRNPGLVFSEYASVGALDNMPAQELNELRHVASRMAELWEGEEVQQLLPLACNAILRTLMEDENLFRYVYEQTYARIENERRKIQRIYNGQNERLKSSGWGGRS